jgi:hypothetical protein
MKEALPIQKKALAGVDFSTRVLTDVTGPFYTLVLELTVPNLATFETYAPGSSPTRTCRRTCKKWRRSSNLVLARSSRSSSKGDFVESWTMGGPTIPSELAHVRPGLAAVSHRRSGFINQVFQCGSIGLLVVGFERDEQSHCNQTAGVRVRSLRASRQRRLWPHVGPMPMPPKRLSGGNRSDR